MTRTRGFRVAYSFKHAQFVVQRGAVVIVPTRAHSACMVCGGTRAEAHDGHTFKPDDASARAPKLCEALNRLYVSPYATSTREHFALHFEDGSPKYGWGAP